MKEESKQFDIIIDGVNFVSDEDGMLDLNEIWRGCDLATAKRPSQWKSSIQRLLKSCGKINTVTLPRAVEETRAKSTTVGTEEATIAYAMFVSDKFYISVINAFVELRRGNLLEAAKIADSTQLEKKAFAAWMEMDDTAIQHALRMIGIIRPNFFQKIIKVERQRDKLISEDKIKQRNYGKHGFALRMTPTGKQWLLKNKDKINLKIEELYQKEKSEPTSSVTYQ